RLAAIVESSDDAIISKTLDGIVTSWNEAAERLFGYRADEILGKPITMIVPPERLLEEQDLLSRIAHGERVAHFETERRRKDGTLVPVSITVSPVKNPDGKTIGVSKTSRDITEQRRSEQEIRRLNADLERRVQERTASLETANRELETFTYTVAHDLRAPLRAMHRFCDLLTEEKAGNLDDEGRGWLCQIATGARRMDTLIENLLNYSRVGRTQVSKGPVDLAPLVLEIVQHIDADVKDRQATVKVDNHLPRVLGDRLLLLQVLMNLLSNAIKFVPRERKPIVQIRATREGDRVRVFVEDNGIGIEARHRDRVFRMFERLHGEEEYPGTGIGLAIVKRAVECMGGQVGFEPAEIQGTRFFIEIPAAE
ncbi:MAG TPA: PAS domain S-box protein, partial [Chthoniobacterales bacterium]|nr:PAS domain S-box protein [Chthoniobacterales bacterium]